PLRGVEEAGPPRGRPGGARGPGVERPGEPWPEPLSGKHRTLPPERAHRLDQTGDRITNRAPVVVQRGRDRLRAAPAEECRERGRKPHPVEEQGSEDRLDASEAGERVVGGTAGGPRRPPPPPPPPHRGPPPQDPPRP